MSHHTINLWIALRPTAHNAITTRLNWDVATQGQYTGPITDRDAKVFSFMSDRGVKQRMFKVATISGNNYRMWSIDFDEKASTLQKLRNELDRIMVDHPGQIYVIGAWFWDDGRQAGTELTYDTRTVTKTWSELNPDYQPDPELPDFDDRFVLRITGDVEEEYISGYTGTPVYPIPTVQLLKFMPDVGEPPVPATELSDVNLGQGQAPRVF